MYIKILSVCILIPFILPAQGGYLPGEIGHLRIYDHIMIQEPSTTMPDSMIIQQVYISEFERVEEDPGIPPMPTDFPVQIFKEITDFDGVHQDSRHWLVDTDTALLEVAYMFQVPEPLVKQVPDKMRIQFAGRTFASVGALVQYLTDPRPAATDSVPWLAEPRVELKYPLDPGNSWAWFTDPWQATKTVIGPELLSTPEGERNTVHLQVEYTMDDSLTMNEWWATGVGLVRREISLFGMRWQDAEGNLIDSVNFHITTSLINAVSPEWRVSQFFPVHVGDRWQYYGRTELMLGDWPPSINEWLTESIIEESIVMNGRHYFSFDPPLPGLSRYARIDTPNQAIVIPSGSEDCPDGEVPMLKMSVRDSIEWSWDQCGADAVGLYSEQQAHEYLKDSLDMIRVTNYPGSESAQTFAAGIGLDGSFGFSPGHSYGTKVIAAEVDGQQHGEFIPNASKYFPLHIGDTWWYRIESAIYPGFDTVYVVEESVIGDTIMGNYEHYYVMSNGDYLRVDLPSATIREYASHGEDACQRNSERIRYILPPIDPSTGLPKAGTYGRCGANDTNTVVITVAQQSVLELSQITVVEYRNGGETMLAGETLAAGLGLIDWVKDDVDYHRKTLIAAEINGVFYGPLDVSPESQTPAEFALLPPYPNPFNPATVIKWTQPRRAVVSVDVYDITGRHIIQLFTGEQSPGLQSLTWNAASQSSGVYLLRLSMGRAVQTRKLLLLK